MDGRSHWSRRSWLQTAVVGGSVGWWTRVAETLARADERQERGRPARSVILLWLQGGPSQLETFDPHPNATTGGVEAIRTAADGVEIARHYPLLAEQMQSVSLVRSVVSKEGDHERATYNAKTGFRPDPTLVHPSLGAVLCHQSPDNVEIPRHVTILQSGWPGRGGYLGEQFDAFKVFNFQGKLADVQPRVDAPRFERRLQDLETIVESEFARGRLKNLNEKKTLHRTMVQSAVRMMSSEQLKAFDLSQASAALRQEFGGTPFGDGCIVASQLIRAGVRCVEVNLNGWDSHLNNHSVHERLAQTLDPAFAALVRHLRDEKLLDQTVVVCGGEFGRTPWLNAADGRDHWPHGFTIALAGGGLVGGRTIGQTDPEPKADEKRKSEGVVAPRNIADIHATVLQTLGLDGRKELVTPIGRPMKLSEGEPIGELLG